jgi:hypothetical protein
VEGGGGGPVRRDVVGVSGDAARPEGEDDVGPVPPDGTQHLCFQLPVWNLIQAAIAIVAHLHLRQADEPSHLAQVLLAQAGELIRPRLRLDGGVAVLPTREVHRVDPGPAAGVFRQD